MLMYWYTAVPGMQMNGIFTPGQAAGYYTSLSRLSPAVVTPFIDSEMARRPLLSLFPVFGNEQVHFACSFGNKLLSFASFPSLFDLQESHIFHYS